MSYAPDTKTQSAVRPTLEEARKTLSENGYDRDWSVRLVWKSCDQTLDRVFPYGSSPEPTTFVTSYIVDGSPQEITIDGMVSFLDLEDWSENDIVTPVQDRSAAWSTSRDCGELRDLVAPILRELQGENG